MSYSSGGLPQMLEDLNDLSEIFILEDKLPVKGIYGSR